MAFLEKFLDKQGLITLIAQIKAWVLAKLSTKVDKVAGKGLSTNDFTNSHLTKLNNSTSVSYSSSLDNGTHIGSITIDGNTTDIYAPVGGGDGDSDSSVVVVDEQGYTNILGLRRATDIDIVKDDDMITVLTTLEGEAFATSEIELDENGCPSKIIVDGFECSVDMSGFGTDNTSSSSDSPIYVQNDEPESAPDGAIWLDLDAESTNITSNALTAVSMTEAPDGTITIVNTLDNGTETIILSTDENGNPNKLTYNGNEIPFEMECLANTASNEGTGHIESSEYPGCYYRLVDGENEWINPPMIPGEFYRTQERYNGNPVYVTCVQHLSATGTNGTTKVLQEKLVLAAYPHIISMSGVVSNTYGEAYPSSRYGVLTTGYDEGELLIDYGVTETMPESTVDIIVKFTLD